eukprot:6557303-Alexandrium_andersonii.AAC.1
MTGSKDANLYKGPYFEPTTFGPARPQLSAAFSVSVAFCSFLQLSAAFCSCLQFSAAFCSVLQLSAAFCSSLQRSAAFCSCLRPLGLLH